jgi:hypothetical protein
MNILSRDDFMPWVLDALRAHGGAASVVDVCRHIWNHHEKELREAGDLFYTWQYDVRWAATKLRHQNKLRETTRGAPWMLA